MQRVPRLPLPLNTGRHPPTPSPLPLWRLIRMWKNLAYYVPFRLLSAFLFPTATPLVLMVQTSGRKSPTTTFLRCILIQGRKLLKPLENPKAVFVLSLRATPSPTRTELARQAFVGKKRAFLLRVPRWLTAEPTNVAPSPSFRILVFVRRTLICLVRRKDR